MELIIAMMMPGKQVRIDSYKDLFDSSKLELPEWLQPLIKASYFMHFFSGEMPLSLDILKEIHSETKLTHSQLDKILVIKGIPATCSRDWVRQQIMAVLSKFGARVLNPEKEVLVYEDKAVVILDGFDHMSLVKDEGDKKEEDSATNNNNQHDSSLSEDESESE